MGTELLIDDIEAVQAALRDRMQLLQEVMIRSAQLSAFTHPLNDSFNISYQHTLSIHLTNIPYQHHLNPNLYSLLSPPLPMNTSTGGFTSIG